MEHAAARERVPPDAATSLIVTCLKLCDRGEHITAEDLWESVALQAFAFRGVKSATELERCGIRNAEDVGRIVAALRSAGHELPPVDAELDRYEGLSSAAVIIEPCLLLQQDPSPVMPALAVDVLCLCQYNLRGLRPDGKCPECGMPIALGLFRDSRLRGAALLEAAKQWCPR